MIGRLAARVALILAGMGLLAGSALAQSGGDAEPAITLSANAGIVSDYRFRGVSLSDRDPAVQGGIDASLKNGLFVGTWASSIADYGGSNTELDVYGGYSGSAGGVDFTLTALGYLYPGGSSVNYFEVMAEASHGFGPATLGAQVAWVPDQSNFPGDNVYMAATGEYAVGETPLSLFGHVGYETNDFSDKWDWELGASYAIGPVTASLSYVDTDHSGPQEAGRMAKAGVVASLVASF